LPISFPDFTFVDLGSGKGRTLLMASDYPFHRIIGIELLPSLHAIAQENIRVYRSQTQKCFAVESICTDARNFAFPGEPIVGYLFNPFPEDILRQVIQNFEVSLEQHPRPAYLIYHNPVLPFVIENNRKFRKIINSDYYSIYVS
jgi:SAM-dependent methyltransferase